MATKQNTASRRSFLATVGVGAAALAVPAGAVAAGSGPATQIPALREWYRRELERFMQDVKPELLAGTMGEPIDGRVADYSPQTRLEEAVCDRFGLHVREEEDKTDGGVWLYADSATAHMILAVSPSAEELGDGGWHHPAYWAQLAVAEDVLKMARERGWLAAEVRS